MSSLLVKVPKTEALVQGVSGFCHSIGRRGIWRSLLAKGKAFLVEGVSGFRSWRGPTTTLISQRPRKASRRRRWFERREQPSHALTWMGQIRAPRKCSASWFSVKKAKSHQDRQAKASGTQVFRYSAPSSSPLCGSASCDRKLPGRSKDTSRRARAQAPRLGGSAPPIQPIFASISGRAGSRGS